MILLSAYNAMSHASDAAGFFCGLSSPFFCATAFVIGRINRQTIPYVGETGAKAPGIKQQLRLWRIHRENFPASWLRTLYVGLLVAGFCLFIPGIKFFYDVLACRPCGS
jgi:hypothetical protein